jgi:hypothetical protein
MSHRQSESFIADPFKFTSKRIKHCFPVIQMHLNLSSQPAIVLRLAAHKKKKSIYWFYFLSSLND